MVSNNFKINERELMEYYGYKGKIGEFKIKIKFAKNWIFHYIAYSSPIPSISIKFQRFRGVKIGNNCHISPYVLIDLLHPELIRIGNNVTISSNSMIFSHVNMTANEFLKTHGFPRLIKNVEIKDGAVISVGCILTAGVTIGKNSIIGAGSVVTQNIPDNSIAIGNPARIVKKIPNEGEND